MRVMFKIVFVLFFLFPTLTFSLDLGKLSKSEEHAQALSILCIQTRLDPNEIHRVMELFEKKKKLPADVLKNAGNKAELGYAVKLVNNIYILTYGSRQQSKEGPFCSVAMDNVSMEAAKALINQYFTTFELVEEAKVGLSSISVFKGIAPGFQKDLALSIQTEVGMSAFSIYYVDP